MESNSNHHRLRKINEIILTPKAHHDRPNVRQLIEAEAGILVKDVAHLRAAAGGVIVGHVVAVNSGHTGGCVAHRRRVNGGHTTRRVMWWQWEHVRRCCSAHNYWPLVTGLLHIVQGL